ncbi:MAG: hypothetical protein JWR54_1660 [Mucilaginibacter sp.]|jgi:hypothetical protein|nr:hypothetical protein [Mucilaginibacter sp.]
MIFEFKKGTFCFGHYNYKYANEGIKKELGALHFDECVTTKIYSQAALKFALSK